jgi:tripartite ATP-independent transporter DctP family solute receptor
MKKLIVTLLILVLTLGFAGCGGGAAKSSTEPEESATAPEPIIIKAAHVEVEDRAIHQALVKFGEDIAEKSDGVLQLEIHPNGELGDDSDVVEAIGLGTVQMTVPGSGVFTSYDEKFAVMNLPYLFESKEQMDAAFTGEFGDLIGSWLEDYGFVCLGYNYDGMRCMSNNVRPITKVADMKGIKFRVMDSDLYINMFKLLGANPTPMGFSEVYTALQQGVIDGQDNPAGLTYGSKFHEHLKYFSKTGHVYANCPVIISKEFFEGLDPNYQDIIRESAKTWLEDWQRSEESAAEAGFVDDMAAAGVAVNDLTPEAIAEFKATLQPIYDQYREKLGDEVMDQVLEFASK